MVGQVLVVLVDDLTVDGWPLVVVLVDGSPVVVVLLVT